MRRITLGITVAVALLLAAGLVFVLTFDVNRLKPFINSKVSEALDRPFAINGDLRLDWRHPPDETGWRRYLPWPRLSATDVRVGNPAWASTPQVGSLQAASFEMSLLPLLRREISVPHIKLVQPTIDLERLADGRNNWTFKQDEEPSAWKLQLGDVIFDRGVVRLKDAQHNIDLTVQIDPLGKPVPLAEVMQALEEKSAPAQKAAPKPSAPDYAFGFKASGSYNRAAVAASGKIGGVLSLTQPEQPFPLQVDATVGDTHIVLAGTVTDPAQLAGFDMHLKLASPSMARLYPLTGITLPETPPFATQGRLKGMLAQGHGRFHYEHFSGRVGGSDLGGDLLFALGKPRPKLSGSLHSTLLQFEDLAPLIGGGPQKTDKAAADAEPVKPQPADRVLPVAEFRTDRWQAMDADVNYRAERILHKAALPVEKLSAHILMDDGVLTLQPVNFSVAGGNLKAKLELRGNSSPMQGKLDMQIRSLKLQKLFPNIEQMKSALGDLNGDIKLEARGNSVATLAASSSGEVKLLVAQGVISRNLLELAGLNIANVVVGKIFGDKTVNINCAAANLVADKGQVDSRLLVVDTQDALIHVEGGINLANEQMDFDIRPESKGIRILSLRTPLYVRGTFKQPKVGVDVKRLAVRGGAVVALGLAVAPVAALLPLIAPSASDDTQCGAMIRAMRTPASTEKPGQAARKIEAAAEAAGRR